MKDNYNTITNPTEEILYKVKGSKFYGCAFPVINEDEVKQRLDIIRKKHHTARHVCYAYQFGEEQIKFRANDDGEPSNSAGMPIYGQIQSFELTNVLVVVVRYFGGVKLGVGGLISAYRISAKLSLENSNVVEKTIDVLYKITFNYDLMNTVQRIIKEKELNIIQQKLTLDCEYVISVRKNEADVVLKVFRNIYKLHIKTL